MYKKSHQSEQGVITIKNANSMMTENVISTYSYTSKEWCDMLSLTILSSIAKVIGIEFITTYLTVNHSAKPSEFYDSVYKEIIIKKAFNDDFLNDKIGSIPEYLYSVVSDDNITLLEFDIDKNFPFILAPHVYLTFLIMINPTKFFDAIVRYLSNKFDDERLIDLGNYLSNIIIDLNYDPVIKRKFTTEYNWRSYFNNNQPLVQGLYEYSILDELLKFSGSTGLEHSDYPEQTDYMQKLKQFFYHRGSNQTRVKYAEHIIEQQIS
jgi:hypothetical protein